MRFAKLHGLGNDYVVINDIVEKIRGKKQLAEKLCKRRFGVGADGVIFITESKKNDLGFRIFNPDGSEAEMCGNGIRCFAKYVYEQGVLKKKTIRAETKTGTKTLYLKVSKNEVESVTVDMGAPVLERSKIPMRGKSGRVLDEKYMGKRLTCVNMGNPHAVFFVKSTEKAPVETLGPKVENDPVFPQRTNVEFVEVVGKKHLRMRVWERGVGETLACGTGACASVVAACLLGKTLKNEEIRVDLLGGPLWIKVEFEKDQPSRVWLRGAAETVYLGETV